MTRKWTGYNLRLCFLLWKKCSKPRTLEWYFGRKESIGSYKSSQIIENCIVTKHDTGRKGILSVSTDSLSSWVKDFLPPFQNLPRVSFLAEGKLKKPWGGSTWPLSFIHFKFILECDAICNHIFIKWLISLYGHL